MREIDTYFLIEKPLKISGLKILWSWRESNPRPNEETIRFLHAYLCLGFSSAGKTRATNLHLIP